MSDETNSPDPSSSSLKEFAQKYKTHIVITAAASAASAYLANRLTLKVTLDVSKAMLYEAGRENAALVVQNSVLLTYINEKGLADEVRDYVTNL